MSIKTHLTAVRRSREIAVAELAKIVGISRQTLHAIEAGDYLPNTAVTLRLARALDVSVEQIFALDDEAPPSQPIEAAPISRHADRNFAVARLAQVEQQVVAIPSFSQDYFFGPMDAIRHGSSQASLYLPLDAGSWTDNLIVAGCDPAAPVLVQHAARAGINLIAWHSNSSEALSLLRRRRIHIAGCHLRDSADRERAANVLDNCFSADEVAVVTLMAWEEGLAVKAGNPKVITGAASLAEKGIAFVNRERGAGARRMLDEALQVGSVTANEIDGYNKVVHAHLPAARLVAERAYDACLAPRPVAELLGLHFIPLLREQYQFVLRRESLELPKVKALLDVLNTSTFRRSLRALPGYDTSNTGRLVTS